MHRSSGVSSGAILADVWAQGDFAGNMIGLWQEGHHPSGHRASTREGAELDAAESRSSADIPVSLSDSMYFANIFRRR
jgi:hypothetical protein